MYSPELVHSHKTYISTASLLQLQCNRKAVSMQSSRLPANCTTIADWQHIGCAVSVQLRCNRAECVPINFVLHSNLHFVIQDIHNLYSYHINNKLNFSAFMIITVDNQSIPIVEYAVDCIQQILLLS